jgi:hypothetical protein
LIGKKPAPAAIATATNDLIMTAITRATIAKRPSASLPDGEKLAFQPVLVAAMGKPPLGGIGLPSTSCRQIAQRTGHPFTPGPIVRNSPGEQNRFNWTARPHESSI